MKSFTSDTKRMLEVAFWKTARTRFSSDPVQQAIAGRLRTAYGDFSGASFEALPQALLRQIGVHQCEALFFRHQGDIRAVLAEAATLPKLEPPSWEIISTIEILGTFNLAVAQALMPEPLKAAAAEWPNADANRQIELCQAVYQALLTDTDRPTAEEVDELAAHEFWMRDYRNQPLGRIFPLHFLKYKSAEPNCFGKGQLLVAFCRLTGIRHFGATPLHLAEDRTHPIMLRMGEAIAAWAKEHRIELPKRLEEALARRVKAGDAISSAPNRFHMGVVLELADKRWYFIDPHMQSAGLIDGDGMFGYVADMVDLFSTTVPGFTAMASQGSAVDRLIYKASMAAGAMLDHCKWIQQRWASLDIDGRAAIPLLGQSAALEVLVEEGVGIDTKEKELVQQVLGGDAFAIVRFAGKDGEMRALKMQTTSGRELTPREHMRFQIAAQVLNFAGGGTLFDETNGYNVDAAKMGLERCLGILQAIAYKRAARELGLVCGGACMVHPLMEIYEPCFRTGIELLAHLNALTACSHDVVMDLARLCGGQHHLLLAVTEPFRTGKPCLSSLAAQAVEVIQQLPFRLPLVAESLQAIESMGLLKFPSELQTEGAQ